MDNSLFGEAIYSYSRAQAIEDGVLVDLAQFEVTRQEWRIHVACTDTVWSIIDQAVKREHKDYEGILHDIYQMARLAIADSKNADIILFRTIIGRTRQNLKFQCSGGDKGEPVLTLMLPNED